MNNVKILFLLSEKYTVFSDIAVLYFFYYFSIRRNGMAKMPHSFDDLIRTSDLPVLVDFYADWCGPCKMVSPVVARLASEYKGRLVTVKINTEKKQSLSAKYAIQSIPTIMLFHKGRQLMRLQGAYPYDSLKAELDRNLP